MRAAWIVYRKELQEIVRDRRTLMAIGLAALATPLVLFVISRVSTQTATQIYTVGYSGTIPTGLDVDHAVVVAHGLATGRRPVHVPRSGQGRSDQCSTALPLTGPPEAPGLLAFTRDRASSSRSALR